MISAAVAEENINPSSFLLFITIIGIPFARKHLELAALALAPFGKRIVYE